MNTNTRENTYETHSREAGAAPRSSDTTTIISSGASHENPVHRARQLFMMLRHTGLQVSHESDWETLAAHVEVHKYLINRHIGWTITWEDAVFSWYENVYVPTVRAVHRWDVRSAFPDLTDIQLYTAVSNHWHYLQTGAVQTGGAPREVDVEDAALDFVARYGRGPAAWVTRLFSHGSSGASRGTVTTAA